MPSRKEPQRALSGKMNLLAPRDKIADEDALLIENFRVDQANCLRTRLGAFKGFGPVGSGRFHTIKYAANVFFGIGSDLRWGSTGILIETGYDGEPLGIVAGGGYTYIMNRAANRQRRMTGAGAAVPWCPEPPASAPTVTPTTPTTVTLETFESGAVIDVVSISDGVTEVDAMVGGVPAADPDLTAAFDATNFQEGSASLKLTATGPITAKATVDLGSIDTSSAGVAHDKDYLRLWVRVSDPTQIESLTVTLLNAATGGAEQGKLVQCYFQPNTSWDAGKILNQAPGSWTQLHIRRRLDVDGQQAAIVTASDATIVSDLTASLTQALQNPTFLVIAQQNPQILGANNTPVVAENAPDFDWTAVSGLKVSLVTRGAVEVNLDLAEFTGDPTAAVLSGTIQYYVSYIDDAGHESLPSPASDEATFLNETATLSAVPVSPASNIVARRIWRIGGGLTQALKVGDLWGNVSTGPFVDPFSNDDATNLGEIMPVDRTPPPAARGVVGPFFGKFIAYNTDDHPARYYWTPTGVFHCFPGQDDEDIGNWEDCGAEDDQLLTITDHKTILVMYKARSIWRLQGDPNKADPVKTNSNISAVGELAVCAAGQVDYLVAWEGVYRFNLDGEEKLSQAIDPIFKGDRVRLSSGDILPAADKARLSQATISVINERLRVSYPEVGGGFVVAILNLETGAWAREKYTNLGAPNLTVLTYFGGGFAQLAGGTASGGGYWYALEYPGLDDGGAIPVKWQTRYFDQGLPDNYKWYSDIEIEAYLAIDGTAPSTLTVKALFDDGSASITLGTMTVSSANRAQFTFRVDEKSGLPIPSGGTDYGYRAKNCSIRVDGDSASELVISACYLHYYPEERLAHVYDSGFTDLGMPERVKQIDYVEGYFTGQGQDLQRVLSSDLPGSLLTVRESTSFTSPTGRGNRRFRLTNVAEGRNFRLTVNDTPAGIPFQAHQIRVRMRPIGEYIDGTTGEFYESPEFSIAPGRVSELKDFLLDYDVSAAGGYIQVFSDLPGTALSVRRTIALPYQSGSRAPYVFPLEYAGDATSDFLPTGQLFKVRIYPPGGGILRLHGRAQFRGRVIGTYFNGANSEVWETQPIDLFGGEAIAREMIVIGQTAGAMTMQVFTEMPGQDMTLAASFPVDTSATSFGRIPISSRLPGNTKGQLWKFKLSGRYITRLFEVKILGRRLMVNAAPWDWINVPLEPTPDAWANIAMPIRETPEAFEWVDLAVDPVG